MEKLHDSYGVSLAIWDHTVLPSTRHKWMHPAFAPARGMEGIDKWLLKLFLHVCFCQFVQCSICFNTRLIVWFIPSFPFLSTSGVTSASQCFLSWLYTGPLHFVRRSVVQCSVTVSVTRAMIKVRRGRNKKICTGYWYFAAARRCVKSKWWLL